MKIKVAHYLKTMVRVSNERLKDLLCGAIDPGYGGSEYWIQDIKRIGETERAEYRHEVPFKRGCALEITVDDAETHLGDPHGGKTYKLDRVAIDRGLEIMADKYPQHFADFRKGDDDAGTADVFLQCCLFGEVVYG